MLKTINRKFYLRDNRLSDLWSVFDDDIDYSVFLCAKEYILSRATGYRVKSKLTGLIRNRVISAKASSQWYNFVNNFFFVNVLNCIG